MFRTSSQVCACLLLLWDKRFSLNLFATQNFLKWKILTNGCLWADSRVLIQKQPTSLSFSGPSFPSVWKCQCSLLCLELILLPVHILILSPSLFCGQFFLCTLIFLSTQSCWTTSSSVLGALDWARTCIVLWGCQGVNTEADFPWPVVAGTEHFLHVFSFSLHVDRRRWLVLIPHFKCAEADLTGIHREMRMTFQRHRAGEWVVKQVKSVSLFFSGCPKLMGRWNQQSPCRAGRAYWLKHESGAFFITAETVTGLTIS